MSLSETAIELTTILTARHSGSTRDMRCARPASGTNWLSPPPPGRFSATRILSIGPTKGSAKLMLYNFVPKKIPFKTDNLTSILQTCQVCEAVWGEGPV